MQTDSPFSTVFKTVYSSFKGSVNDYNTVFICPTTCQGDTSDRSALVDIIICLHSRGHLYQYYQDKDLKEKDL